VITGFTVGVPGRAVQPAGQDGARRARACAPL